MNACCPCNTCVVCGSNNVISTECTCGRDHYAHCMCGDCGRWWFERPSCFLCDSTGLRMDVLAQVFRIENPTYTCNGCNGTGRKKDHPIGTSTDT
jgi:hypothetical protein